MTTVQSISVAQTTPNPPPEVEVVEHFRSIPMIIEPSNICNMQCVYCGNSKLTVPRRFLSLDEFRRVVDNLGRFEGFKTKQFLIQGNGEPFVHPNIYDYIDLLADCGRELLIVTNGKWRIKEEKLDSLFKVHVIRGSVDAMDQQLYQQVKPRQVLSKVVEKFQQLRRLRDAHRSPYPAIWFRINVFKYNEHHVEEYIQRCRDYGFDKVQVVLGGGPALERVTSVDSKILDAYGDFLLYDTSLRDDAQRLEQASRGELRPADTTFHYDHRIFDHLKCFGTTIRCNGEVTVCCMDPNVTVSMGNLLEKTYLELISKENLDRVARFIVDHRNASRQQCVCATCPRFKCYLKTHPLPEHLGDSERAATRC